jgi:hypothetical protein
MSKRIKQTIKFNQHHKKIIEELIEMLERHDNDKLLQHPETTINDLKLLLNINFHVVNPWVKCWYTDRVIDVIGIFRLSTYIATVVQGIEWTINRKGCKIQLHAGLLQYKVLPLGTDDDSDSEEEQPVRYNNDDDNDEENVYRLEIPNDIDDELEYIIKFKLKTLQPMRYEDWTDNIILSLLQYTIDFPIELYLKTDIPDPDQWLENYNCGKLVL